MRMNTKGYISCLGLVTTAVFSTQLYASDYSLPFVNTSGLGNLYSNWATAASDASTAATNPAGLAKIHNRQVMGSIIGLAGTSEFTGQSNTIPSFTPNEVGTASTNLRAIIPTAFFAIPICKNIVFGMGVYSPFALGTNYAKDSIVRYAATRTQIVVVDFNPSIGVQINDKLSVGIGLDFDRLAFTVNHMYGFPLSVPDSELQNHLSGWGYGLHAGVLYDITKATRIGLSYNSQVTVHATGDSEVFSTTGEVRTTNQRANAPLPTLANLSIQHTFCQWTFMGTLFYTHWSSFEQLTLRNTMIPQGVTIPVTIPFHYHDTFDYALGASFKVNPMWTLRSGIMYLNTPSNNRDRSLPDPIGRATIVGVGAHYQQNRCLGYDLGYAHSFFNQTRINGVTPINFATGHSTQYTNVIGAQITWDMV